MVGANRRMVIIILSSETHGVRHRQDPLVCQFARGERLRKALLRIP